MDIAHVAKKISDWIRAAEELKQQLPPDDLVVDDWVTKLINFQSRIPLLECLTAKAIKVYNIMYDIVYVCVCVVTAIPLAVHILSTGSTL